MPEGAQEHGRRGVARVKRYLESTTRVAISWNAYEHEKSCTLLGADGKKKVYDLRGHFLNAKRTPLVVESKHYTDVGTQGTSYRQYLVDAYSTTAKSISEDLDENRQYMWVTWHPFSLTHWTHLTSTEYVKESVKKHLESPSDVNGENPPSREVDLNVVSALQGRLWVIVLCERQEELMLSPKELKKAMRVLDREGGLHV